LSARLTLTVSTADVNHRVMLRRALAKGGFADVLGILESWDDGELRVRRRDGDVVPVAEADLVAGMRVPPPRARRRPRSG
jgi:hypothetical protein